MPVTATDDAGRNPAVGDLEAVAALDEALPVGVHGYVELPLGRPDLASLLTRLGAHRAKFRTGGDEPSDFPDEATLAAAIRACVDSRTPFKLTAGLHSAVRHRDPVTGFEHHGFLNVLVAVATAREDPDADAAAILAERHGAGLARRAAALTPEDVHAVRALFTSFGTCEIDEPIADLTALGLLS